MIVILSVLVMSVMRANSSGWSGKRSSSMMGSFLKSKCFDEYLGTRSPLDCSSLTAFGKDLQLFSSCPQGNYHSDKENKVSVMK